MKIKSIFVAISTLLVSGGLIACGGESSVTPVKHITFSHDYTDVAAPAGSNINIEFWHTNGKSVVDELEVAAADFAEIVKKRDNVNVNVNFTYQGNYDDLKNKVNKSFSGSTTPTITYTYPDHVADYLALQDFDEKDYVVNLEDLIDNAKFGFGKQVEYEDGPASDFVESFYQEGSSYVNEGIYSLPFMKSTEVMYYNETVLLKSNAVPKLHPEVNSSEKLQAYLNSLNWDEFMTLAAQLKENLTDVPSLVAPVYYDSDANLFISQLYQSETPYLSIQNGAGIIDFDNDDAKQIVRDLRASYKDGLLLTKGTNEDKYGSDYFKKVQSLFNIGSSGGAGYSSPQGGAFTTGVCTVPAKGKKAYVSQGPNITFLRNPGISEAENDLRIRYGWEFIKYLTSAETNAILCCRGSEGYIPVRKSAYDTEYYKATVSSDDSNIINQAMKVVVEDIEGQYLVTPNFKGSATARVQAGSIVSYVLASSDDVETAISTAFKEAVRQVVLDM